MSLSVEFYHPTYKKWADVVEVKPGMKPVIMPQIMPDGERKIYALECDPTDHFASISTYNTPEILADDEIGLVNLDHMEKTAEITVEKDHVYFLSIKSNKEIARLVVRFSQN